MSQSTATLHHLRTDASRRQNNTHLDPDTWALVTDCDATTYCNANGTCAYKGCRKDIVSRAEHDSVTCDAQGDLI